MTNSCFNSINGSTIPVMLAAAKTDEMRSNTVHFLPRSSYSHDNPGVVLHDGVVQVESSEVHDGCTLHRWHTRVRYLQAIRSYFPYTHTQEESAYIQQRTWALQAWKRCRSQTSSSHSVWIKRLPHDAPKTWTRSPQADSDKETGRRWTVTQRPDVRVWCYLYVILTLPLSSILLRNFWLALYLICSTSSSLLKTQYFLCELLWNMTASERKQGEQNRPIKGEKQ